MMTPRLTVAGALDPNFGWADGQLYQSGECAAAIPAKLRGAYACASVAAGAVRLARDPLGLNKLFWVADAGEIVVAARPWRLVDLGYAFEEIQALPCGALVELDLTEGRSVHLSLDPPQRRSGRENGAASGETVEAIAGRLRATLDAYCRALADSHAGSTVFVCLSGGLDSTGALMLALEHFRSVVAVSFDLRREQGPPSADRLTAQRLSQDFGVPLLEVTPSGDELLEGLDAVLKEGIDWRDFNVHAGLVNHALARAIAGAATPGASLVVTGDLPNEFLVDYHAEQLNGRTYYALPRLSPPALQGVLIRGLDTSHREIGPFQAWQVPAVQVYAPGVDHYLELPGGFLSDSKRKDSLCRSMFGDRIPEYVYTRPKTRAQVGDVEVGRGVLGLCLERGIDAAALRSRFAELHGLRDPSALDRFIRGGRYRASIPGLTRVA
jgi:asparagine synthetase B (glutamine-hydrolysing)